MYESDRNLLTYIYTFIYDCNQLIYYRKLFISEAILEFVGYITRI